MKKRIISVLLAAVMVFALLPAAVGADGGTPYLDWDESKKELVNKTCESAMTVDSDTTTWNAEWYVVSGSVTVSDRITVTGDVHLILADGCTLTAKNGIEVSGTNSLTIYGQAKQTGKLKATSNSYNAGIGGNHDGDSGAVTINGGIVTAEGTNSGAGIGGGRDHAGGTITINGGNVEAKGQVGGAGIGGGSAGDGGNITINGGTVTAQGRGGAGIGGGGNGNGGTVTITGGIVKATGGIYGAGIGGGERGSGGIVTITGGTVTANGGSEGAGIGGGEGGSGGIVMITGGNVTTKGGTDAAGIGGGNGGDGGTVTITGGTVTVTGDSYTAGIGGGRDGGSDGSFSTGTGGNAVIFASSQYSDGIADTSQQSNWSGIIFNGNTGEIYGTPVPEYDFNIQSGKTLNVKNDQTLHIGPGVTMTNNGTVNIGDASNLNAVLNNEGTITNKKTIDVWGELSNGVTGITNQGSGQIVYHFNLEVTTPTFDEAKSGYSQPSAQSITITSTGEIDATITGVSITEEDFVLNNGSNATLTAGASDTSWAIQPKAGLSAGTHNTTVTVTYSGSGVSKTATAEVTFTVTSWAEGSGTGMDPYLIPDLVTLEAFRDYINSGNGSGEYFKVTADIDMSSKYSVGNGTSWTPIGTSDNAPFNGTFDGGGFTINGLYINTKEDYQGLFGYSTGTIKNLTVSGSVTGIDNSGNVGGIVGYNAGGSIINCHNEAAITAPSYNVGGIVGYNNAGSVENCHNAGAVKSAANRIGGIVGCNAGNAIVKNCYNTGTVSGSGWVGGIVGDGVNTDTGGSIQNCYNTGTVSSTNTYIGGIEGVNGSSIKNCYYLDTCGAGGRFGGTSKTADQFASGEVAYLLQNGQDTQVWGQKLGDEADEHPVLTSEENEKVLKVTFATRDNSNYDVKYTNPNGTVTLPENPSKANYAFERWSQSEDALGAEFDAETAVTEDMTVYAVGRDHFGGDMDVIRLEAIYGYSTALTADLDKYMKYANKSVAVAGKFVYEICDKGDTEARINENTLTVPTGLNAGDHIIQITATEKEPQYSLMSVGSYGTEDMTLTVKVSITKADSSVTVIPLSNDLTYSGEAQELVTAGETHDGTIQYSLDNADYSADIPKGTEAKTYTVWYKVVGDSNHNGSTPQSVEVTIKKANSDVTVADSSATYGDTLTLTAEVKKSNAAGISLMSAAQDQVEFFAGETSLGEATVEYTDGELKSVGTATLTVTVDKAKYNAIKAANGKITAEYGGSVNLNESTKDNITVTLNKKTLTYTAAATNRKYNGDTNVEVTLEPTNAESSDTVTLTATGTIDDANVGDGKSVMITGVTVGGADAEYYQAADAPTGDVTVNIEKADSTVVAPTAKTDLTYNGAAQELVTAGTANGGEMLYSLDGSDYSADIPTGTDAKAYTVWYKVVGDANHQDTEPAQVTVTIGKATVTVTAPTAKDLTYTGAAQQLVTVGEVNFGALVYSLNEVGPYSADIPTGEEAGTYTVYYKVEGTDNWNASAVGSVRAEIKKAASSATVTGHTGLTYSGGEQALVTAESVTGGTVVYALGGSAEIQPENAEFTDAVPQGTNAGTYYVWWRVRGDANHSDTAARSISVAVSPAPVTFRAMEVNTPYTGAAVSVAVAQTAGEAPVIDPAKISVSYEQNGAAAEPLLPGSYDVFVTVNDPNFTLAGGAERVKVGTLTVTHVHEYAEEWTRDAENHWHVCRGVGTCDVPQGDKAAHAWGEGVVTLEPTAEAEGNRLYTCSVCGATRSEPISRLDTFRISGVVTDNYNNPLAGATVRLTRGQVKVAEATTDSQGRYSFSSVPAGLYNVAATWETVTKTILVEISDADANDRDIQMPAGNVSSVVEVLGEDTPDVVAGGVDALAEKEAEASPAETVTVTLTVEKNDAPADKEALEAAASSQAANLTYLEMTLTKETTGSTVAITEAGVVLEIVIPFDFTYKTNVTAYRSHNDMAEVLTKDDSRTDGTFRLDEAGGKIYIYASKFSTYAIGYTPAPPAPPTYNAAVTQPEHGSLEVNPSRAAAGSNVTVTVTPDEGYELGALTVTDSSGRAVEYKESGDGAFTFVMPSGGVKIDAAFVPVCKRDDTCPIAKFTDAAPTERYHDGVHYCVENGLMVGTSATTFSPDMITSRAMVVTVLWKEAGSPAVNYLMQYDDVEPETWYTEAIRWATSEGIAVGYGNGKFGPDDPITNEQIVTVLWRYAKIRGWSVSVGEDTNILSFKDFAQISEWAVPAIQWAVGSGVMQDKDGIFSPQGQAARAQTADTVQRFLTSRKVEENT